MAPGGSSFVENTDARYSCQTCYRGRSFPIGSWGIAQMFTIFHSWRNSTREGPYRCNTAWLSFRVNISHTGERLICATLFNVSYGRSVPFGTSSYTAAAPTRNYTCETNPIMVLYSPRNLVISPRRRVYGVGDRLHAEVSSVPLATIRWFDSTAVGAFYTGSVLVIDSDMAGRVWIVVIQASNTLGDIRHAISTMIRFRVNDISSSMTSGNTTASGDDMPGKRPSTQVWIILIAIALLLALCVVCACCRCCRRGRLQKKKRFTRAASNKTSEKSPLVSKIKRKLVSKGKEKSQLASKSRKQLDSKPSGKSSPEDRSSKKLNSKRTTFEKKSTKENLREKKHTPPEKGFKVTKSK